MAAVVSLGSAVAVCQNVSSSVAKDSAFLGLRVGEVRCGGAAFALPMVKCSPQEKAGSLEIVADKKVQKRRQIVLTQDIPALGKTGELLTVKTGYFRNYLYPTGKAKIATADLLKSIKQEQEKVAAEKRKVKEEAENIARQFQAVGFFNVRRRGGQGKQIFGSVTSQDVVDIIRAQTGRDVDKRVVTVPEIREIGQYTVEVKLHPEVIAPVKINVIAK